MWNNPPLIVFLGFSHVDICRRHSWYSALAWLAWLGWEFAANISMNFNAWILLGLQNNVSGDQ
jgi:hypothetical protein